MDAMFQEHHPKGTLKKGKGLFMEFFAKLKKNFPDYNDKVLLLCVKIFTRFRLRAMNYAAKNKKKKGPRKTFENKKKAKEDAKNNKTIRKRAPVTDRGKIKLLKQTFQ